jgi:uncharacterized protein YqeY
MSVKDQISADLKEAMKANDPVRRDTLRSVLSAFTYRRVEAGHDLSDEEQLAVIQKQVKQRADSIAEYEKAGRAELVAKESHERDILATYLPEQLSVDEVRTIVRGTLAEIPAEGRNQGAVMKAVMPKVKGRVDGTVVRTVVTEELASA